MHAVFKRMRAHLLAVLIRNDVPVRRTRIRTKDNTILEDTSDDGRTSARRLGQVHTLILQEVIPTPPHSHSRSHPLLSLCIEVALCGGGTHRI